MRFYSAIKQCKDDVAAERKFMTARQMQPAVGPQSRIYRTVSETPKKSMADSFAG